MLTVSEISGKIKTLLEYEFENVELIGEISNYKHHTSGHRYFVLKDKNAQISAVMWQSQKINFIPKDGMKVIVRGSIDVYVPQGKYQISCRSMVPAGEGDLYLAYEALKQKLLQKGYFDNIRKRSLPKLPMRVGISTSPTGAAIQDMKMTISRRQPLITIIFRPTLVQGDGSAEDIVKAIEELNRQNCDVIIIGRGGGSIEDLWSYNTEIVADAIYNSKVPVISAVGHESDFTISDFVADLRASTPTAAAEIVSSLTKDELLEMLSNSKFKISKVLANKIDKMKNSIQNLFLKSMYRALESRINNYKQLIDSYDTELNNQTKNLINIYKQKTNSLDLHLKSLDPMAPLRKGYSLIYDDDRIIEKNESLLNYETLILKRKNENVRINILEKL